MEQGSRGLPRGRSPWEEQRARGHGRRRKGTVGSFCRGARPWTARGELQRASMVGFPALEESLHVSREGGHARRGEGEAGARVHGAEEQGAMEGAYAGAPGPERPLATGREEQGAAGDTPAPWTLGRSFSAEEEGRPAAGASSAWSRRLTMGEGPAPWEELGGMGAWSSAPCLLPCRRNGGAAA